MIGIPENIESKCDYKCEKYCPKYQKYYDKINGPKMRWLTISPPYSDIEPRTFIKNWVNELAYINSFANEYIIVFELTEQLRLHMHIVYSLKDKTKEYLFLNRIRLASYPPSDKLLYGFDFCKPSQVKVYNGQPAGGIHYLFKNVDELIEYGLDETEIIHLLVHKKITIFDDCSDSDS